MPRITLLGAGSTVFARALLGDILQFPELAESTIRLHDIDEERLETSLGVARHLTRALRVNPTLEATRDRRAALDGADYAIGMFQVAGYAPGTITDFEIPKRYGLRQTIADTLGIGGIMRALRTIPVLLEMCRDMEELCPEVVFLNYVNPMAMNMMAIQRASRIASIGLCHSVQGTAWQLSRDIGVPFAEIEYLCAGINHMAFYLKLERRTPEGTEDLVPHLRNVIEEGRVPEWNRVRYAVFERLGYFVTESSEHFAEYVPWFIKRDRPDLIERYQIPLDEYLQRCEAQIASWALARDYLDGKDVSAEQVREVLRPFRIMEPVKRGMERLIEALSRVRPSHEYGARIIHSLETGAPRVVYGNVANRGLIDNLPKDCCVEVPCSVDAEAIRPTRIGALPPQLAALIQTNVNVQTLAVEAALTGKREHVYHAAMLDPHTAAELDLDQIHALVDELLEAHRDWLPQYC